MSISLLNLSHWSQRKRFLFIQVEEKSVSNTVRPVKFWFLCTRHASRNSMHNYAAVYTSKKRQSCALWYWLNCGIRSNWNIFVGTNLSWDPKLSLAFFWVCFLHSEKFFCFSFSSEMTASQLVFFIQVQKLVPKLQSSAKRHLVRRPDASSGLTFNYKTNLLCSQKQGDEYK